MSSAQANGNAGGTPPALSTPSWVQKEHAVVRNRLGSVLSRGLVLKTDQRIRCAYGVRGSGGS